MPNIKRLKDLIDYTGVLPYASEIFGVYQPLIGWRSKQQLDRVKEGLANDRMDVLRSLAGIWRLRPARSSTRIAVCLSNGCGWPISDGRSWPIKG